MKADVAVVEGSPKLIAVQAVPQSKIVDTTELRWFAPGPLSPAVTSWFTEGGAAGTAEERCDTYRLDRRHNVGVKLRSRETLELKVRRSVGGTFSIASDLVGRLETWRKWSPAGGLVASDEHARWIDVCKTVTKRRFSADGNEFVIEDDAGQLTWAGCDVEVVAITVDNTEVWSFAFAAFGPLVSRKPAIVAAWRALNRSAACTDDFAASFAPACGYPHWLAGITSRTPVAAGM